MHLIDLFTIRISLGQSSVIGKGTSGLRVIAEVSGGIFEGERLRGTVLMTFPLQGTQLLSDS